MRCILRAGGWNMDQLPRLELAGMVHTSEARGKGGVLKMKQV